MHIGRTKTGRNGRVFQALQQCLVHFLVAIKLTLKNVLLHQQGVKLADFLLLSCHFFRNQLLPSLTRDVIVPDFGEHPSAFLLDLRVRRR